jgi:hypothetical protein
MKYTREFMFFPNIRCYDYQQWGHRVDCYPLPPFNQIAIFLENKGWEIIDYKEIKSGLHDSYPLPDHVQYGLLIHAVSYEKPKDDEKYVYRAINERGDFE